jgi:hypothetical protein
MLRFAVDENFNLHIVNGVLRRLPDATGRQGLGVLMFVT